LTFAHASLRQRSAFWRAVNAVETSSSVVVANVCIANVWIANVSSTREQASALAKSSISFAEDQ
jgi:hypothetical protein